MAPQPTLAVVGAGPTGSFAATRATERGARVQVYEEHPTVGEPSHCVGHLSLQGLGRLSLTPPPKVIQKRVTRYRFYSPSGVGLTLEPPEPRTVIVNRALFDHWLSLEAERKGSFIQRGCRVESIHMDGGGKVVLRIRRGRDIRMESVDLLIDSEGYPPALLIKGGLVHPFSSRHVIGILVDCEGVKDCDEEAVEVYFGSGYADGFYAWIAPLPDGSAKVGLASRRYDPRALLRRFIRKHPVASGKLARAKTSPPVLHPIPLTGPLARTCWPPIIAVGDAASQVKATTGGGVVTGLLCAQAAGEAGATALLHEDPNLLFGYERSWRRIIGFDLKAMAYFRKTLNILPDRALDRLFSAAAESRAGSLLNEMDLDLQGSSALVLFRKKERLSMLLKILLRLIF